MPGSGYGTRFLTAPLTNLGTVQVGYGLTIDATGASHANGSLIDVSGGDLSVIQDGSFTHTGSIAIASGRFMTVRGGSFSHNPGITTATGTGASRGTLEFINCAVTGLTLESSSARVLLSGQQGFGGPGAPTASPTRSATAWAEPTRRRCRSR